MSDARFGGRRFVRLVSHETTETMSPKNTAPNQRAAIRRRPVALLAAMLTMTVASAAEKTYQYFRFAPTRIFSGHSEMQLSEFTFSIGGTVLNINNRDGSSTNVLPVAISSGGQDPNGGEGPGRVADGSLNTKWYTGNPLSAPLDFAFNTPVTIDSYNWASANDSVEFTRSPVSWRFFGSTNGTDWELLDSRSNVPISNQNFTYQAGFTIPDELLPGITLFEVQNTPTEGTAGIVLNGSTVSLAWQTEFTDSVILGPGGIALGESGSTTVLPDANSTSTYSLTATRTGSSEIAQSEVTVRTVAGGSGEFRYVRFVATKLRSGSADGTIQLAEFGFMNGTSPLTGITATNPGGDSPGGEGIGNLVDGNGLNNKWLDFGNAPVIFDLGETKVFDGYYFFTANDAPSRDPVQWTLEGSNDQTSWAVIEIVDFDYSTPEGRNLSTKTIPLPGASIPPTITTFTGDGVTVIEGQPLTLSWTTSGAETATIDPVVGAVATSGAVSVVPPLGETTYTLTASSAGGVASAESSFTVNVIPVPAITTIDYGDFSSSADELSLLGSAQIFEGRLRLTEDIGSQRGEAWFRTRQSVTGGFEATFGLSMNQENPSPANPPADGIAFMIQNSPAGSNAATLGEDGLPENALNIKFKTFGFDAIEGSQVQVRAGSTVLAQASVFNTPGTELSGLPDFPYSLATVAGAPAYRIRVVYVAGTPGDLDIYLDDVAILQNVAVDLEAIGAVDMSGNAFVGFAGRTGLYFQNNDITDWTMAYGDFSALPPFGLVKSVLKRDVAGVPVAIDLVWNSEPGIENVITTSTTLSGQWADFQAFSGFDGQIGYRIPITPATVPAAFFRVEEAVLPAR